MNTTIDKDLFSQVEKLFDQHLKLDGNSRIIFSGRFGTGKTTFVDHFFSSSDEYNPVHIYPVNYSVATNEDIFKYIKYDLLFELIVKEYPIEIGEDFNMWWALASYINENVPQIASTFIAATPEVGKEIGIASMIITFWNNISDQFKKVATKKKEINDRAFEHKIAEKYLDAIQNDGRGLYDFGIETKLIRSMLEKKKEENSKRNVLIIDDLDRIDPEHTFRILNVFAAHLDENRSNYIGNKFGFDQVVIICDIQNVRNIFHNKYGADVDFSGYIDKFYSHAIFEFFSTEALINFSKKILEQTKWIGDSSDNNMQIAKLEHVAQELFLSSIIAEFLNQGLLNLRSIIKWQTIPFYFQFKVSVGGTAISTRDYRIITKLALLIEYMGSKRELLSALRKLSFKHLNLLDRYVEIQCLSLMKLILIVRNRGEFRGFENFDIGDYKFISKYNGSELTDIKVIRNDSVDIGKDFKGNVGFLKIFLIELLELY